MSITTLQSWQVETIKEIAQNNPDTPEAIWSVLANWGDKYAQAAWAGLTQPNSLYGKAIYYSNSLLGIDASRERQVMKNVAQGYVQLIADTRANPDGSVNLPTSAQIEDNYYRAALSAGADPLNAIDLSRRSPEPRLAAYCSPGKIGTRFFSAWA